ncbi:MAG: cell division protein SepF [Streptosporangiaceae bacterium]
MASAMRKMAVYLGLVEDDGRYEGHYQDEYGADEEYEEYGGELAEPDDRHEVHQAGFADNGYDGGRAARDRAVPDRLPDHPAPAPAQVQTTDLTRITTLHPRTYNEARTIGEHFRDGTPVIMNLTEMVDSDAKRLVDFSAGLIFGLRGSIERVTNKVFLLSPANVEVAAEDKARIAERDFFNQS